MKILTRIATGLAALILTPAVADAQLVGQVAVEGEYEPIVIETDRLNEYPVAYRFELPQITLNYDTEGQPTQFAPSILSMGLTGWNTMRSGLSRRGFLDLRLGSFLDSRVKAYGQILNDSVNLLTADFNFRSTSLFRAKDPTGFSEPSRRQLYDGMLGVNYTRLVGNEGLFSSRIAYRVGWFDYYGSMLKLTQTPIIAGVPTQTVNQINVKGNYASSQSYLSGWRAGAELLYTGYRSFIFPDSRWEKRMQGDRETELKLNGGYNFGVSDNAAFALDGRADVLFYADRQIEKTLYAGNWRKDYAVVSLTPAFRFRNSMLQMQAGLDLDFSFDAMGNRIGEKYGFFHAAPDVSLDYRAKQFGLHISATGGSTPVTLAGMEKYDLYQMPILLSTQPVYSPLDAKIGLNFGPFSGFSGDVALRYAIAKHVPLGGWYAGMLSDFIEAGEAPDPGSAFGRDYQYTSGINLHGFSVGLNLRYILGDKVEAKFAGTFTPQNGETGIFNGFDRPKWVMDAEVKVWPVKKLRIEAALNYRGNRNIYRYETDAAGEYVPAPLKLRDIVMLNARISYSLLSNFEIYCLAENLCNRKVELLPALPSAGIAVSGGIYWEF